MKMAFDPEATKLFDVLAGGYHLNAKLLALLGRPLDSRGQEEAMAFSQEISRVFMVSMSMLKPDESKRTLETMAPEISTSDSYGVCTPAKDKVIREGVISHKSVRREEFTRKEVTSSPHSKDGYQWQKYGQKNIQNCSFMRYYFRCHDRRCNAKKKVQQQDGSDHAPMFEVTYVNDHTCHHVALANNGDGCSQKSLPTTTTTAQSSLKAAANTGRNGGALFDLLTRIGDAEENDAIVSCLATVISGIAPSSPGADPGAGRQQPSADGGSMLTDGTVTLMDTGFSWEDPSPSFWSAEAAEMMDLCDDVHMDAARFVDTMWPQYST